MKTKITLVALAMAMNAFAQVPNYLPTQDLFGWYPFNGNANEEYIHFANGTVYGATPINDRFGKPNSAYSFDGIDDHISLSDSVHNFQTSDFTISAWLMKYDTVVSGSVFAKRNSTADGNMLNLLSNPGYEISTGLGDYKEVVAPKYKLINTWYHVVWVRSGYNIKIYQNGIEVSNINTSTIHNLGNKAIAEFGARYNGTKIWNLWHGAIDDIGIWKRALNQQEITNIYNGGIIVTENLCFTVGKDSASLFKNGYGLGNNLEQAPFSPCESDTWTKSKWINVKGVDSIVVKTLQHRLYDSSKIYDKNNKLIWKWTGEDTGSPTWYTKKHNLFIGGNDSVRIEFHQGFPNFCGGLQIIKLVCGNTCYYTKYDTVRVTVTDTLRIKTTLTNINPVKETTIKVYPNPTNSNITISCENTLLDGYSINILNAIGQTVYTGQITQPKTTINLSSWTGKGIYFLHLLNKNQTIDVRKIVLQ